VVAVVADFIVVEDMVDLVVEVLLQILVLEFLVKDFLEELLAEEQVVAVVVHLKQEVQVVGQVVLAEVEEVHHLLEPLFS
jgi:hypothetical protein